MEPLVIDWAKDEAKDGENNSGIFTFIANNSIFKSIDYAIFFSQINSAEGVLPNDEF